METENTTEQTHDLKQVLAPNFTFTKRQVGILLAIVGIIGFLGILALDFIGGGREGGIGPTQQMALIGIAGVAILGFTLIPLGDDPV